MYARRIPCRVAQFSFVVMTVMAATNAAAQMPAGTGHEQHEGHAVTQGDQQMPAARDGSGTSWLPDQSPMYAIHAQKGPWTMMFHENAFLQFLHESGARGDNQTGSINWWMGMAQRSAGPGRVAFRGMFSLEPWSVAGCGYPDLLATGEECDGQAIHDRQHPHDLFMELAAEYNAPIVGDVRWQLYAAPAGEPALGPVAYPHRVSALPNPLAPISHHWLDSTHITFGVVTGGVYGQRWKVESSVFNGREPDEQRRDLNLAALDSVSGRVWFLPNPNLALQVSAGNLKEAEPGDAGGPRTDLNRVTASATLHHPIRDVTMWATTVAWGRNAEGGHASHGLLVETNLSIEQRDAWFGRFEVVGKSAHDLVVPAPPDDFSVAKLQGGYTRYLAPWNGFQPGLGGGVSVAVVPAALKTVYGSRANAGLAVYLTLRPAAMMHTAPGPTAGEP